MTEIELSSEEEEYLKTILERRTVEARASSPRTLQHYIERWRSLVRKLEEGHPPGLELFANEVTCREIIELDIKQEAPMGLREKLDGLLQEWDERYIASTGELDVAWFGDGNPQLWWWYHCPKAWHWYELHKKGSN
jgi:hypothetical protein